MQLGKHVYCEKPLTHSVWESRRLAELAREHKVATQMGNQGQASEETRRLCEMIWDNAIGPVREAHVWTDRPANGLFNEYWPQGVNRPRNRPDVPATLDWDLWLGPAPARPYNSAYLPFRWRGWWDFGTGALGDIGCHALDPVFRALKLGHPTSVQASSTRVNDETYPLASMVTYQFPARDEMPPLKLVWYDGGLLPPRPDEMGEERLSGEGGVLYIGSKGKLIQNTYGARPRLLPVETHNSYGAPAERLPRIPHQSHEMNWVNAIKGKEEVSSPFSYAGPLTEIMLLGVVSLRANAKLHYDAANMRVTNHDEANEFLTRTYRAGYSL
jgi:predicted dehydrogenase